MKWKFKKPNPRDVLECVAIISVLILCFVALTFGILVYVCANGNCP